MTRKDISDGVGNISTRHIQEAASYMAAEKKVSFFKKPFGRSMSRLFSHYAYSLEVLVFSLPLAVWL